RRYRMLLTAVTDHEESLAAFELLRTSLRANAQVFPGHGIGWQGGSRQYDVYWLSTLRIWTVLEPSPPIVKKGPGDRFWNCFGIDDPNSRKMLRIVVEMNPPHAGENRRVAGLFAKDDGGRIYVGHSGNIGGGRKGIGQREFRKFLGDHPWHEVAMAN